jgi:hypothetical protein
MGQKISYRRRFEYNDECKCYICSYNIKKEDLLICFPCNKYLHIECEELFRMDNEDFICNNCGIKNSYGTVV